MPVETSLNPLADWWLNLLGKYNTHTKKFQQTNDNLPLQLLDDFRYMVDPGSNGLRTVYTRTGPTNYTVDGNKDSDIYDVNYANGEIIKRSKNAPHDTSTIASGGNWFTNFTNTVLGGYEIPISGGRSHKIHLLKKSK